jgi:hypothetical protein
MNADRQKQFNSDYYRGGAEIAENQFCFECLLRVLCVSSEAGGEFEFRG